MDFPSWAPKVLCNLHRDSYSPEDPSLGKYYQKPIRLMLERLLTYDQMRFAWNTLFSKLKKKFGADQEHLGGAVLCLFMHIADALMVANDKKKNKSEILDN